jgi:ketosteroid isomerase-like protein
LKEESEMPARKPEEINTLFAQYMRDGDLDAVMTLYDDRAVFMSPEGEPVYGPAEIRQVLAPFAAAKAEFYIVKAVIESGDIALTHNVWAVEAPEPGSGYAIEVSRRQPDGSWRWLIGDPFTVARQPVSEDTARVPEEVTS